MDFKTKDDARAKALEMCEAARDARTPMIYRVYYTSGRALPYRISTFEHRGLPLVGQFETDGRMMWHQD